MAKRPTTRRQHAVDRFNAVLAQFLKDGTDEQRSQIEQFANELLSNDRMTAYCIEQLTVLLTMLS